MAATATTKTPARIAAAKRRYKAWMMFIVLFMGWAAYTFIGQLEQQRETNLRLTTIKSEVEASRSQSEALQLQIERLNDPEYISQLATKEQGMVREGERQIFSE